MGKVKKSTTIELDAAKYFKNSETTVPVLKRAARNVTRSTKRHFKKDGWDLDYNFLVTEVFYEALGHHLENYLWKELVRQKVSVVLTVKDGRTVLRKIKPTKKAAKK